MKLSLEKRKKYSNIASRQSIKDKTMLFVESYSDDEGGDCFAILHEILKNPYYKDWDIVWALPDSIYIDDRIECFGDRIRCIKNPSTEFVDELQTYKIVFTTKVLPTYFIKRQGQVIVGLYSAGNYRNQIESEDGAKGIYKKLTEINKDDFALHRSLVKSDIIYAESEEIEKALALKQSQGLPFKTVKGKPLRYSLETRQSAEVVVSVSDEIIGPKYPDLETHFKEIKTRVIEYDRDVFFRISHKSFIKYLEENDPKVLSRTGSRVIPICQDIKNSELLITDMKEDYYDASKLGVPCILVTSDITEWDISGETEARFAGNWKEICEQIDLFYQGKERSRQDAEIKADVCSLIDEVKNASEKETDAYNRGGILFVLSPHLTHKVWDVIRFVKNEKGVGVLFTDDVNESLWICGDLISRKTDVYCQIGEGVSTDTALRQKIALKNNEICLSEDDLKSEWGRIVGNRTFDKAYYVGKPSDYWKKMMEKIPADEYEILNNKEFTAFLLENIKNPLLESANKGIKLKSELDDKQFHLATDEADVLLLDSFSDDKGVTLSVINDISDVDKCRKLTEKETDIVHLIFDPHEILLNNHDITKKENVRWMPLRKFPLRALFAADRIALIDDNTLYQIAEHCGKEILSPNKDAIKRDEMSDFIGLLACEDIHQMV